MTPLFPVMAGGAIGAALRYWASVALPPRSGWPLGTLAVNILGGLLMGLLAAHVMKGSASEAMRLFAGVGILGGFTTFSAFSLETALMIERRDLFQAGTYIAASVTLSVVTLFGGLFLARRLFP